MSLFGKLKERLFKSSSKLDEGLNAIVASDPAPEPETPDLPEPGLPEPVAPEPPLPELPEPAWEVPEPGNRAGCWMTRCWKALRTC
jgi:fused signal recognition particle receptor